jgi:Eukaryotic aspartyl protease
LDNITWVPMLPTSDFKINLGGFFMNDRSIEGSEQFKVGFIDTGTTFAYFPSTLIDQIRAYF